MVTGRKFVKEGGTIDILFNADTDKALTTEIAPPVELVVADRPRHQGDTATGRHQARLVESGATVNVPLFINEGDVIRVDTETGTLPHPRLDRLDRRAARASAGA